MCGRVYNVISNENCNLLVKVCPIQLLLVYLTIISLIIYYLLPTIPCMVYGIIILLFPGEFGVVYKGKWTSGKEARDVAIKTLRGGANSQDTENFLMEASVMRQFRNHHVVQLFGIVSKVEPIMIIMEFMKNGSLEHYLKVVLFSSFHLV